ncbi:hypothetical protein HAX54_045036, partial [Datura stramonium]|nr:hypothetical protein [Datura stramonium]
MPDSEYGNVESSSWSPARNPVQRALKRIGPRCSENIKYIIFGCQRLNTALEFWQLAFLHDSSEVAPAHIVWNLEDLIT